jgi:hypothetical protein
MGGPKYARLPVCGSTVPIFSVPSPLAAGEDGAGAVPEASGTAVVPPPEHAASARQAAVATSGMREMRIIESVSVRR